jgi:hypothetical protein
MMIQVLSSECGVWGCYVDEGRWVKVLEERKNWSFRTMKVLTLVRIILHL